MLASRSCFSRLSEINDLNKQTTKRSTKCVTIISIIYDEDMNKHTHIYVYISHTIYVDIYTGMHLRSRSPEGVDAFDGVSSKKAPGQNIRRKGQLFQ